MDRAGRDAVVENDAQLIQNVRTSLGGSGLVRDSVRINVSSCKSIITLHGVVRSEDDRRGIGAFVREVAGVRGIENRLRVHADSMRS